MALGDTITIRLAKAVAGLGDAGTVLTLTETLYIENVMAAGWAALYAGSIPPATPPAPSDGQLRAWSQNLGQDTYVNPVGQSELASAQNITGVATNASAAGVVGTAVDIPGTALVVPASNGRPVVIRFQANGQQTAAGLGTALLNLIETTSGTVNLMGALVNLPNSAAVPAAFLDTIAAEFPIGVVTTPRSFKLQLQLWAPAANSPSAQVYNAAANPTLIRAVAG